MMLGRDRLIRVVAAIEAIRAKYPTLRTALSWRTIAPVLQAERVRVLRHAIKGHGYVVAMPPAFTIVVNRADSPGRQLGVTAHELGHIVMHIDRERVKQLSPCLPDDPRELEAKLFARMLLIGERGTPAHPKVRPIVAALVAGEYRRKMPSQLPLELPERVPVYGARDLEWQDEMLGAARPNPRLARLPDAKRLKLEAGKPWAARYVDRIGRVWTIYDRPGKRYFYNSLMLRQVYRFRPGEITHLKVKHLDRQLREARPLVAKSAARRTHSAATP